MGNKKYLNVTWTKAKLNLFIRAVNNRIINNLGGIYLLKVNNRNTRTRCEICSKLTIKTLEQKHSRRSGVFLVDFEHNSHIIHT